MALMLLQSLAIMNPFGTNWMTFNQFEGDIVPLSMATKFTLLEEIQESKCESWFEKLYTHPFSVIHPNQP